MHCFFSVVEEALLYFTVLIPLVTLMSCLTSCSLFHHRRFFLAACDVPSLEDKFNVDQYSDLVTVTKPVIYISIGEMINTHTVSPKFALFFLRSFTCTVRSMYPDLSMSVKAQTFMLRSFLRVILF